MIKVADARTIIESDGIFILDKDANILFANNKAKKVYKMQREIVEMLKKDKFRYKKKAEEINIYPIFLKNEPIFVGIIRNRSREMEYIRNDIAHYFFNPIAIAKGYLDLLLDDKHIEKNKIEKIKIAIERIETVVKNIVMNGKIEE